MRRFPATALTRPTASRLASTALLASLTILAACGGGGGSSATAPATPSAPASSASQPTSTAGTRITCNLPNFEAEMLAAVNARRRAGASCGTRGSFPAAPDLAWNAAITQAAVAHSDDMVARNFFDHTGSDGSSPGDRMTAAGYPWRGWGENIAAGQSSVAEVVDGWMKSDGHCANLMNAAFRDIGVACVAGNAGTPYRSYWTQDFGTPR
ncbi:CAP domain-containing protein [Pelomonas sp. P7]|uniref:CAP domain-containing protein n=1 Tax=Pelomonas caseinilytica TaxID=2906763 RepID=A0ABS8X9M9_9BURK|nr:CAP domain-containing protein [Pelomonas sp. P7]MCE4535957.1 CAP domain-containing protein [Pelomonas sp. P7]